MEGQVAETKIGGILTVQMIIVTTPLSKLQIFFVTSKHERSSWQQRGHIMKYLLVYRFWWSSTNIKFPGIWWLGRNQLIEFLAFL